MQLRFFLYISFLVLIVIACTKNSNEGNNTGGGGACSGTPGAKFTAVKTVLTNNCALSGCHSGTTPQNGISFTDNCTIVAQATNIKLRAVDQAGTPTQMPPPPSAPLSAADRQKITDWVAAGGKLTD